MPLQITIHLVAFAVLAIVAIVIFRVRAARLPPKPWGTYVSHVTLPTGVFMTVRRARSYEQVFHQTVVPEEEEEEEEKESDRARNQLWSEEATGWVPGCDQQQMLRCMLIAAQCRQATELPTDP